MTLRQALLLLIVLGVAAGAMLWVQGSRGRADDGDVSTLGRSASESEVARDDEGLDAGSQVTAAPANHTGRLAAPMAPAAPGRCVVVGRLVDEDGAALSGVLVQLFAKRRWARESPAASLESVDPSAKPVGYEERTDEDGRFRFDVEPPSARFVELSAIRSPLAAAVERRFGRGGDAALVEGVRDLGDLVMRAAGAVRGSVLDDDGVGLEGAQVELLAPAALDGSAATGPAVSALSGPDGTFEIRHCVPGSYDLRAAFDGRVAKTLFDVSVVADEWAGPFKLRLATGPGVSGRVVDDAGAPLEGAKVQVRFPNGRIGATTMSGAGGEFRAVLTSTDDVRISASLDGHITASIGPLATPAPDVEVALRRESRCRVQVLDRATGRPVGRFGIAVVKDGGSRSRAPQYTRRKTPGIEDHGEGVAEVAGRIGVDLILVEADGYIAAVADFGGAQWPREDVLPEAGRWRAFAPDDGPLAQTIALDRGATLRGEFAVGAWKSAQVELSQVDEREVRFHFLSGSVQQVVGSADDPRFEFTGLEPGTWQLCATTDAGTSTVVRRIELAANESRDLGLLELVPSGAVTGTVKLPPNASPPEVSIAVVDVPAGLDGVVDAQGRFRIDGVPAGERTIRNTTLHTDLMWGGEVQVVVPPGGEVEVFLDLSQRGLLPIEVTVELNGRIVQGAEVRLVRDEVWPRRTHFDMFEDHEIYLGPTHSDGTARGRGRALGMTRPAIAIDRWKIFSPEDARIVLEGTATLEARVALTSGDAVLALPDGIALPENGSARFTFESLTDPRVRSWTTVQFEGGAPLRLEGLIPDATLRSWQLPTLPLGEWMFRVELFESGVGELPLGAAARAAASANAQPTRLEARATIRPKGLCRVELTVQD